MNFEVKIDDPEQLVAVEIARERYNAESSGSPGFALVKSAPEFVQMMVITAAEACRQRYVSAPQNMAEALNRIDDLKAEKAVLTEQVATLQALIPPPTAPEPAPAPEPITPT